MKIIQIKKLSKIKFPRYIYETVRGDKKAEKNAIDWARKHGVDTMYRFDMGYGTKWIVEVKEQ